MFRCYNWEALMNNGAFYNALITLPVVDFSICVNRFIQL